MNDRLKVDTIKLNNRKVKFGSNFAVTSHVRMPRSGDGKLNLNF